MAYKTIEETFWKDTEMKRTLSFEERSLLAYLITNPHAHYSGVYYLPKSFIVEETRLTLKVVDKYLRALSASSSGKFYAMYDEQHDVVWVKNMLRYQVKASNKKKILQGTAKQLKTLHGSPLIKEFLGYYREEMEEWLALKTINDKERESLTTSMSALVSVLPAGDVPVEAPETPPAPPETPKPAPAKEEPKKPDKKVYGEFKNVKLLAAEYEKLVKRFGEPMVKEKIEELSGGISSIYGTKKYKDHYATLTVWIKRALKDKEGNMPARPEHKVCTAENPMPEGAKMSEWRHPEVLKRMAGDRCTAAKCKHCAMDFQGLF